MANKRLKKKYTELIRALAEVDESTDIQITRPKLDYCYKLKKQSRKHAHMTPVFRIHEDDLDTLFEYHYPGEKYHAEDCNDNNPNNKNYVHRRNRHRLRRWRK